MAIVQQIAQSLNRELEWFEAVVNTALTLYFKNDSAVEGIYDHQPPSLDKASPYEAFLIDNDFGIQERIILMLALAPHIKPQALDVFLIKNQNLNTPFSEFGGTHQPGETGFSPTLETACFILAGDDIALRLEFMKKFHHHSALFGLGILNYDKEQHFSLKQPLRVTNEFLGLITHGKRHLPQYGSKFPAQQIETALEWEDLIVNKVVAEGLKELKDWLLHSEQILNQWKLSKNLKAGYRALFYGAPGTGKTLAATLLGKETQRPVFRVDLSLVVSKYIGETEKNLSVLFDEAENKDWILFFDEADSLFGKRTQVANSNDRYANQEVAYLLQRIEDFRGLVILASNLQTNLDEAFSRRFQGSIHFTKPDVKQRRRLWASLFESNFSLSDDVDLDVLSRDYELTGGEMINVLRYCALQAARRNEKLINLNDIRTGVRKEYSKSNKTI